MSDDYQEDKLQKLKKQTTNIKKCLTLSSNLYPNPPFVSVFPSYNCKNVYHNIDIFNIILKILFGIHVEVIRQLYKMIVFSNLLRLKNDPIKYTLMYNVQKRSFSSH